MHRHGYPECIEHPLVTTERSLFSWQSKMRNDNPTKETTRKHLTLPSRCDTYGRLSNHSRYEKGL